MNNIVEFLSENRDEQSRFEIDKHLLQRGYHASDIEGAWKELANREKENQHREKKLTKINTIEKIVSSLFLGWAIIATLILIKPNLPYYYTGDPQSQFNQVLLSPISFIVFLLFLLRPQFIKTNSNNILNTLVYLILIFHIIFPIIYFSVKPGQREGTYLVERNNSVVRQGLVQYQLFIRGDDSPVEDLYKCDFIGIICIKIDSTNMLLRSQETTATMRFDETTQKVILVYQDKDLYTFPDS